MNKCLTVLVVDDDPNFIEQFLPILTKCINNYQYIPRIKTKLEIDLSIPVEFADIVFLDIQMPDISGFKISKYFSSETKIIYISSHEHYVFCSFEHKAYGFIRKLNLENDLYNTLHRYFKEKECTITIPYHGKSLFIKAESIIYISVCGNYTSIHCKKNAFTIKKSLRQFEKQYFSQLEESFAHISKHTIVNMHHIYQADKDHITLCNSTILYISRSYSLKFREKYYTFLNR